MADCSEGMTVTESVKVPCSVVYDVGSEGLTSVTKFSGTGLADCSAVRVGGSQSNWTLASSKALPTTGQIVFRSDSWIISVSTALQAEG